MKDIRHNLRNFNADQIALASMVHRVDIEDIHTVYGPLDNYYISDDSGTEVCNIFFMKNGSVMTSEADWMTDGGLTEYVDVEAFSTSMNIEKSVQVW